jgi:hypothetical protein
MSTIALSTAKFEPQNEADMKIFQIKNKYIPANWCNSVKENGVLEYFVYGSGYKKTKNFTMLEIVVPDKPSWLDIVNLKIGYGIEVAGYLAEQKTAGCMAKTQTNAKTHLYIKSKEHWDNIEHSLRDTLFEKFAIANYFWAHWGIFSLDVIEVDNAFAKDDKEYNPVECTYKGEPNISSMQYAELKYGKDFSLALQAMI